MGPMRLEKPPPFASGQVPAAGETSLWRIFVVSSMGAGIQFGWAIQLSLLTPYVQLLGIPHKWASYIWFFGPISAIIVQPLVGHYSDRCTSRFGRRRPFIAAGAILNSIAVCLIGYAADIGYLSGDVWEKGKTKTRAIAVFGIGFWILDVANNTLQGPCRAFLADLSGGNASKTRIANSFFSFFMAVGNILGYSAGSYDNLHKLYPFNATAACDQDCTNLKNCFFLSIILLGSVTLPALTMVREQPWSPADVNVIHQEEKPKLPFFQQLFGALKDLPRSMWVLLLVTSMNWIGWFPFLLFDIDWMGREVYGGDRNLEQGRMYGFGVRAGEVGLVLNSVVLGIVSLLIEPLCRLLGKVKRLWGIANLILGICLGMTVLVSRNAAAWRHLAAANSINTLQTQPPTEIKDSALVIFAILGIPTAVTYSIPFALASIFSNSVGAGQGLSLGVLNMAIVFPQLIVSLTSGSINSLFCGGNLPGFVMGAIAAVISSILAFTVLPSPIPERN